MAETQFYARRLAGGLVRARLFIEKVRAGTRQGKDARRMAAPVCVRLEPDGRLEILVYEDIGESFWDGPGVTAKAMKEKIDAAGPHTGYRLRINSPGGDAFEGLTIHNMLRAQGKPIESCIDGIAASSASVIAMCGDTIRMAPSSMMMIHNASSFVYGDARELREGADVLDKVSDSLAQTYARKTGLKLPEVHALMDAETWMSAQECLDNGFCTEIDERPDVGDEGAATRARASLAVYAYRNVPERLRAAAPDRAGLKRMRQSLQLARALEG